MSTLDDKFEREKKVIGSVEEIKDDSKRLKNIIEEYLKEINPFPDRHFDTIRFTTALKYLPDEDTYFIELLQRLNSLKKQDLNHVYDGIINNDLINVIGISLNDSRYTPKNLTDFKARIEKMNLRQRRGFLDSMYAGLVYAIKDRKVNFDLKEIGIFESHGFSEILVEVNPIFMEQFADLLIKYGFSNHAKKLNASYQLEQIQRNIQFRLQSLDHVYEEANIMVRISDQYFLKGVVSRVPVDLEFGFSSSYAAAVGRINDPVYLERIVKKYKDYFIVENAKKKLNKLAGNPACTIYW